MKNSLLIGRKADIKKNIDSMWADGWGIIKYYDGEYYHIAMFNGKEMPVFERSEFIIRRREKH